jgi:hypothetical protein
MKSGAKSNRNKSSINIIFLRFHRPEVFAPLLEKVEKVEKNMFILNQHK